MGDLVKLTKRAILRPRATSNGLDLQRQPSLPNQSKLGFAPGSVLASVNVDSGSIPQRGFLDAKGFNLPWWQEPSTGWSYRPRRAHSPYLSCGW